MADAINVSFGKITDPGQLAAKRKELVTLRTNETREWALNRAFYNNNQWVGWNRVTQQVESLPTADGDKARWKVRLTSNQITPGVQHYIAQLTKTRPVIDATPDSSSYRDMGAAAVADALYQYWWDELHLNSKLKRALVHSCISQGWWKLSWDPLAGKSMKVMLDPQTGQPVTNEDLADAYRDEITSVAQEQGIDPKTVLAQVEQTVYVGDVRIDVMSGESVLIDPAADQYTDAQYAVCRHTMDVDEIKARFGVDVTPNTSPTDTAVPLAFVRNVSDRPKTVRDVYIGYFRPSATLPKGRYVVWIEDPNMILKDEGWPYPFNELPLVKFPGLERDDSSLDQPIITLARPLQKELNRTLSQMVQHKDLTIKPQMMAPIGSLRQRLTDEPGAVFEYQPIQGLSPEWRSMPTLQQSAFAILGDIQNRLDRLFNRIPSQRDSMPARVDSGTSIELLQEAVADQMSPVINRMEEALARTGNLLVQLAQVYYIEPRLLKIRGQGGSMQVKKFQSSDLAGGFSFSAETGSGLPRSRAGRQQQIIELVQAGLMDPKQATRYLDLGNMKGISDRFAADEDQANREHEKLMMNQPLNPIALQDAMRQVNQLISDPNADMDGDGVPDTPEEKMNAAQQMLSQAAIQPHDYEDWETHWNVHSAYMKLPEFEQLPLDAQQRFNDHANATFERVIEVRQATLAMDPRVQPKTSFSIKGTASAPVAAELLEKAGVHTTVEELTQPPLDTIVFDSLDKPNASDSGNSPLDPLEQMANIQNTQDEHAVKMAQAGHNLTLSEQKMAQAQQLHAQKMQQSAEMHSVKKKKAMQKPKPGGK